MKTCLICHKDYDNDVIFCPTCGGKVIEKAPESSAASVICRKCGKILDNEVKFCPICGEPVLSEPAPVERCPICGAAREADKKFCRICGCAYSDAQPPAAPETQEIKHVFPKKCPQCGNEIVSGTKFCPGCGYKLQNEEMPLTMQHSSVVKCSKCGAESTPGTKFCPNCGNQLSVIGNTTNNAINMDVYCPSCGNKCAPGVKFCGKCGHEITGNNGNLVVSQNISITTWIEILSGFALAWMIVSEIVATCFNIWIGLIIFIFKVLPQALMYIFYEYKYKKSQSIPIVFKILYIILMDPIAGALMFKKNR